jgi:hypothetical protein
MVPAENACNSDGRPRLIRIAGSFRTYWVMSTHVGVSSSGVDVGANSTTTVG